MAATVGIRSGLSRHWTGSLLELNCNSAESLSDYPDTSTENPFYVHWRTDSTNGIENVHSLNGNGFIHLNQEDNSEGFDYSKEDTTQFGKNGYSRAANFTPNQLFRLRQLISLLHRNFHHRYGKSSSDSSGKSSRNSSSSSDFCHTFDESDRTHASSQNFMCSLGRLGGIAGDHKLVHALFDSNLERYFPNEQSFLVLTKSKRRHCSSEGDLTFVSSGTCDPIPNDRLLNSVSNIANSNSTSTSEPDGETVTSSISVETLTERNDLPTSDVTQQLEVETIVERKTEEHITNDVYTSCTVTQKVTDDCKYTEEPVVDDQINHVAEQSSKNLLQDQTSDENEQISKEKTEISSASLPCIQAPCDDSTDSPACSDPIPRLTKCELSTLQVRKFERANSTASVSSARMVKTVSFADEVGQSLTEVFLFRKTEEESFIPDYDDEFESPFLSFLRKPKASSFGRFTRSRNKRGIDDFPAYSSDTQISSFHHFTGYSNGPTVEQSKYLWFLDFAQPAAQYYEFRQRIENGCVSLENITLTQPEDYAPQQQQQQQPQGKTDNTANSSNARLPQLSGTIKVKNVHFDKKVWIRMTTNNWVTFTDCPAIYNADLSSGSARAPARFDTFTFQINASNYPRECDNVERIEFAIRYCVGPESSHGQFWDNNDGRNYVIERRRVESGWSSPTNSSPSLLSNMNNSYTGLSDYSTHDSNSSTGNTCNPYTLDYRPNFTGISSFTDYRAWEHYASESIYY
ncbi:unnamed protein product [Echinostoma caproni]|uniref:CBM21 domain-containing protein n=1 Tax=Echinostoma caproni TaxID=27848 RepID=A0A183A682_9TREM|nr:unnamed protein product [Echinostoma caproni]